MGGMNTVSSAQRYTSGIRLVGSWLGLGTGGQLILVHPRTVYQIVCKSNDEVGQLSKHSLAHGSWLASSLGTSVLASPWSVFHIELRL